MKPGFPDSCRREEGAQGGVDTEDKRQSRERLQEGGQECPEYLQLGLCWCAGGGGQPSASQRGTQGQASLFLPLGMPAAGQHHVLNSAVW